jgi:hypothetical protein
MQPAEDSRSSHKVGGTRPDHSLLSAASKHENMRGVSEEDTKDPPGIFLQPMLKQYWCLICLVRALRAGRVENTIPDCCNFFSLSQWLPLHTCLVPFYSSLTTPYSRDWARVADHEAPDRTENEV